MKIYKFRKFKLWNFMFNMLLQPLMWFTGSKDSHWWDWEVATNVNESKALVLGNELPVRRYVVLKYFGRYNLTNLRNLYLTLFGIKRVFIIKPANYSGYWSLAVKKEHYKDVTPFFMICNIKHGGSIKYLNDGEVNLVGIDPEGESIQLELMDETSRYKNCNLIFV